MAAAAELANSGYGRVVVVERGPELGGLAGTLLRGGREYPLAYHHILHRDRVLHFFLDRLGVLPQVRWRRIRMLFRRHGMFHELGTPGGLLRFPMALADKLRFARLMVRAFGKPRWDEWRDRSAAELIDSLGGPGVRKALFEPLTRVKFGLSCEEVSGAWLGARLHHREGSAPLGYVPDRNWTRLLCTGLTVQLEVAGVELRTSTTVARLVPDGGRIAAVELADGERIPADVVVAALPTPGYRAIAPDDQTSELAAIRYTAIVSAIVATRQPIAPRCYWMNLLDDDTTASGLFMLDQLNPTLGTEGVTLLNFITHLPSRDDPRFAASDSETLARYAADHQRCFGSRLVAEWSAVSRLALYSPVFVRGFRNAPARSATWSNVHFAGNQCTYPSIASTGTALGSGLEAAHAILRECSVASTLTPAMARFRSPPRLPA